MIEKLSTIFKYIFLSVIWFITFTLPRKDNVWVFGYGDCYSFTDNSKYLFLNTHNNYSNIRCVWITKNQDLINILREENYECYYYYSCKGIYMTLRSNWGFITHNRLDIPWWVTGGMNIVRLNHGLPFKKFGWAEKDHVQSKSKLYRIFTRHISKNYTYSISTSEYFSDLFSEALNVSKKNIWITGYPRMDALIEEVEGESIYAQQLKNKTKTEYNAFYFPTWRRNKNWPDGNVIDSMDVALENEKTHLYCRFHPYTESNILGDFRNVTFLDGKKDFYPLIREMDYFITDYSSLFYDLLFNKSDIIFYAPDLDEYLSDRELYFEYTELPGIQINSLSELNTVLRDYRENDEFVNKWSSRSFDYKDGNSSERIVQKIQTIINSHQ